MRNSHKSIVYLVQNADILGLLCRSRTPQANPAARLARVASRLHITLTHLPCSSRPLQHCTRLPLHGLLRGPIDSLPLPMINDLQVSKLQACCISLSHTFPAHHAHSSIARDFPGGLPRNDSHSLRLPKINDLQSSRLQASKHLRLQACSSITRGFPCTACCVFIITPRPTLGAPEITTESETA